MDNGMKLPQYDHTLTICVCPTPLPCDGFWAYTGEFNLRPDEAFLRKIGDSSCAKLLDHNSN